MEEGRSRNQKRMKRRSMKRIKMKTEEVYAKEEATQGSKSHGIKDKGITPIWVKNDLSNQILHQSLPASRACSPTLSKKRWWH